MRKLIMHGIYEEKFETGSRYIIY